MGCIRTIIDENNHFCRIVVKYLSFVLRKKNSLHPWIVFLKKLLLLIHIRSRVKLIGVHMEIVYVLTTKIGSRLDQPV